MNRRAIPGGDILPVNSPADDAVEKPCAKPTAPRDKRRSAFTQWLFVLSAWGCYLRWVTTSRDALISPNELPIDMTPLRDGVSGALGGGLGERASPLGGSPGPMGPVGLDLMHTEGHLTPRKNRGR